ncbi:MAG TPA: LysE family translocator [Motiliproteus sp.]
MLPLETVLTFTAAAALMGLAPGPDNLYVIAQSLQQGRRAGFWVTLGLCSGLCVHTLAVTLGLAALLATSPLAYALLKVAGALYLLYLAWQAFRAGNTQARSATTLSPGALYRRGILMNISNPKVSIFFLAFLPPFTNPDYGPLTSQLLLLGGLFIAVTLLVFVLLAVSAASLGARLQRGRNLQRRLQQLTGLLFLALSLHLLHSAANL